jgi:hypothetical protein
MREGIDGFVLDSSRLLESVTSFPCAHHPTRAFTRPFGHGKGMGHHPRALRQKDGVPQAHGPLEEKRLTSFLRHLGAPHGHDVRVEPLIELSDSVARLGRPMRVVRTHHVRISALGIEQELAAPLEGLTEGCDVAGEDEPLRPHPTELPEGEVELSDVAMHLPTMVQAESFHDAPAALDVRLGTVDVPTLQKQERSSARSHEEPNVPQDVTPFAKRIDEGLAPGVFIHVHDESQRPNSALDDQVVPATESDLLVTSKRLRMVRGVVESPRRMEEGSVAHVAVRRCRRFIERSRSIAPSFICESALAGAVERLGVPGRVDRRGRPGSGRIARTIRRRRGFVTSRR